MSSVARHSFAVKSPAAEKMGPTIPRNEICRPAEYPLDSREEQKETAA